MCSYLQNPFNYLNHANQSGCLNHANQSGCVRQGNYQLGQGHSADVWSRSRPHHSSVVQQVESVSRTYSSGIHHSHFVNSFHPSYFSSSFENSNLCHINHYRGNSNRIFSTATCHCESEPEYSARKSREASNLATCGSCSSESMPSLDKIFSHSRNGDNSLYDVIDSSRSTYGSTDGKLHSGSSVESNLTDFAELREHIYKTFSEALKMHYSSRNKPLKHRKHQESVSISSCDSTTFKEICDQKVPDLDLRQIFPSKLLQKETSDILVKNLDSSAKSKVTNDLPNESNALNIPNESNGIDSEVLLIDLNDSICSSNQNCDHWATDSSSLSSSSFHSDIKPSLSSSSLSLTDIMSCNQSSTTDSSISLSDLSGLSVFSSEESLTSNTSHNTANSHLPSTNSGALYLNNMCNNCSSCDRNRSVIHTPRLTLRYTPYHTQRYYIHDKVFNNSVSTSDCSFDSRCRNTLLHCGYCDQKGASSKQSAFTDHINIKELLLWIRNFRYRDKESHFTHRPHYRSYRLFNCLSFGALNSASYNGAMARNETMSFYKDNSDLGITSPGGRFRYTDPSAACRCKHENVSLDHLEKGYRMRETTSYRACRQQLSDHTDQSMQGCSSTDQSQQGCRSMVVFTEPQGKQTSNFDKRLTVKNLNISDQNICDAFLHGSLSTLCS